MWWAALLALSLAADHRPRRDSLRGRRHDDDADLRRLADATDGDEEDRGEDDEPDAYPDDEQPGDSFGADDKFQQLQEQVMKLSARLDAGQDTKRIDALETEVGELQTELAEEKAEQARTEGNVLAAVSRNLKPIVHKMVISVSHVVQREKALEQKVAGARPAAEPEPEPARESVPKLSSQVAQVLKPELERVLEGKLEQDVQQALTTELEKEVKSLGNASGPVVQQLNFAAQLAGVVERTVEQNVSARLRFVRRREAPEQRDARALAAAQPRPARAPEAREPEAREPEAPHPITVQPMHVDEPAAPRQEPVHEQPEAPREVHEQPEAPREAERPQGTGFAAEPPHHSLMSVERHVRRPSPMAFDQVSATTRTLKPEDGPTPADIQAALDAAEASHEPELEAAPEAAPAAAPAAPAAAEPAPSDALTPEGLASLIKASVPQAPASHAERAAPQPEQALVQKPKPEPTITQAESRSDFSGAFCSMCGQNCPYAICHGA